MRAVPGHQTISAAFAILGLSTDASSQQVKEAFRDLAQVWHPDRFTHNSRLRAQAEVKMKELNNAYSVVRDYLEGNRQQSTSNSEQANYGERAEETEKNADQAAYSANPTGAKTSRDEDEEVTSVKCPHCGQERRVRLSAEWMAVPLTVRCRQCGKRFKPVRSSDIPSSQEAPPSSSSRSRSNKVPPSTKSTSTEVPPVNKEQKQSWHQDPVWRTTLVCVSCILIPFMFFVVYKHVVAVPVEPVSASEGKRLATTCSEGVAATPPILPKTRRVEQSVVVENEKLSIEPVGRAPNGGQNENALTSSRKTSHSESAESLNSRGIELLHKHDFEQAIVAFSDALRVDPRLTDAYKNRATCFSELGDREKQLSDYCQAIRLNPNDADAYCRRGLYYHDLGAIDKAIADCTESIRIDPKFFNAYLCRGTQTLELENSTMPFRT